MIAACMLWLFAGVLIELLEIKTRIKDVLLILYYKGVILQYDNIIIKMFT